MNINLFTKILIFVSVVSGCTTQPLPDTESTKSQNTNKNTGKKLVLSKDELETLDGFWGGSTQTTLVSTQVSDNFKAPLLRVLAISVIARCSSENKKGFSGFDLFKISQIDLSSVPDPMLKKATAQLVSPEFAEIWTVDACDDELKWIVIGAEKFPFISSAPEGF